MKDLRAQYIQSLPKKSRSLPNPLLFLCNVQLVPCLSINERSSHDHTWHTIKKLLEFLHDFIGRAGELRQLLQVAERGTIEMKLELKIAPHGRPWHKAKPTQLLKKQQGGDDRESDAKQTTNRGKQRKRNRKRKGSTLRARMTNTTSMWRQCRNGMRRGQDKRNMQQNTY